MSQTLRQRSESRFLELSRSLPTRRDENYRYTSLRNIELDRKISEKASFSSSFLERFKSSENTVLVNALGAFKNSISQNDDLEITWNRAVSDFSAIFEKDIFANLCVSRAPRELIIKIADGAKILDPIKIVLDFDSEAGAFFQPIRIEVGESASVSFVLEKTGGGQKNGKLPLAVIFTQVLADKNSSVVMNEWNDFWLNVQDFSRTLVHLDKGASATEAKVFTGGAVVQYRQEVNCAGERSSYEMDSAVRGESDQHFDFWIHSRHPVQNTRSEIEHWAVMSDQAKAIFNGNMIITETGMGTEASQTNHNKLLSDRAAIHSIPKLEIATDDVKCSHGARVVPLDDDQLYYLMARGISETESKRMLVDAFTDPVVEKFIDQKMKDEIRAKLTAKSTGQLDSLIGGVDEEA